jgi:hypothetical protein
MNITLIFSHTGKWIKRLMLAFMLGFSNAINHESNTIEGTTAQTEQTLKR